MYATLVATVILSWGVVPPIETAAAPPVESPPEQLPQQQVSLSAEVKENAREHYRKATAAYDLGRYEQAAHEYELAYENSLDPSMLFNTAQSYRQAKKWEKAIFIYSAYVRVLPNGPMVDLARTRIAELKTMAEFEDPFASDDFRRRRASARPAVVSRPQDPLSIQSVPNRPAVPRQVEESWAEKNKVAIFVGAAGWILGFALGLVMQGS